MLETSDLAVVYRAHDPALDIHVAIKLLAEHHAGDPEIRARFVSDAHALRKLADERIVAVHDTGEYEGRPYLVMELIDGGTLEERLSGGRILGTTETDRLIAGLGAAVVVVHAAGFVHGSITPSNLLIRHTDGGDQVVLADFGPTRAADRSRASVDAGADLYTAPEQRMTGVHVDGRADVYAASGVIGRAVFGADWRQVLVPSGPHQATALEPPGTEPLAFELRRGVSTEPAHRHASISEWTEAVLAAASDHASVVESEHAIAPRRRPVVRLAAAGLVVLAMVLALATVTTQ